MPQQPYQTATGLVCPGSSKSAISMPAVDVNSLINLRSRSLAKKKCLKAVVSTKRVFSVLD